MDSFKDLLKRLRRAAGLTQEELAGRGGISVQAVRCYERGARLRPHPDTVELLIKGLGMHGSGAAQFRSVARGWKVSESTEEPSGIGPLRGSPASIEIPEGITDKGRDGAATFLRLIQRAERNIKQTLLKVYLWHPRYVSTGKMVEKRAGVRRVLEQAGYFITGPAAPRERGHTDPAPDELDRAEAADLTLIMAEDKSAIIEQAAQLCATMCANELLHSKLLAELPDSYLPTARDEVILLSAAHAISWYTDDDLAACNVQTSAVDWCEAKRTLRALAKVGRRR